jgi:hypothetical protein
VLCSVPDGFLGDRQHKPDVPAVAGSCSGLMHGTAVGLGGDRRTARASEDSHRSFSVLVSGTLLSTTRLWVYEIMNQKIKGKFSGMPFTSPEK